MTTLLVFLSGAVTLGFALIALFFLRFWRDSREGLFLHFSIAFVLLAAGQGILTLADIPEESRSWVFLLRLAAFTLILVAVIRKNIATRH
jgi:hypothetical protein